MILLLTLSRWPDVEQWEGSQWNGETMVAEATGQPTGQHTIEPNIFLKALDGLIIRDSRLRGGRPVLAGTGVTVRTVVGHYKLGLNAEQIADRMELELVLVYAALTYYHLHQDEIEADILADSEEVLMQKYGKTRMDVLDCTERNDK